RLLDLHEVAQPLLPRYGPTVLGLSQHRGPPPLYVGSHAVGAIGQGQSGEPSARASRVHLRLGDVSKPHRPVSLSFTAHPTAAPESPRAFKCCPVVVRLCSISPSSARPDLTQRVASNCI